ncbi:MAG TPA: glycosyltransferase 87 family protein, partial [Ktedonobacterales bacterium]
PYTDQAGFWKAIAQFPNAGATPLQRGQFAQQPFAPDDALVSRLLRAYAQHPGEAGSEFDPASLHSYPAGAFLLAVPFIWAGLSSTQLLYALFLLLLLLLLLYWSPKGQRWQTLLILASLSLAILLTLRSSFEVVCILCILGAWRLQERRPCLSAIFLGIGCSVKQLTWLFLPFYLLWVVRRAGWKQASISGALCGLVFFVINAPFLLASPVAWASSMLLPITEPAFPGGIGLIALAQGGWLPSFPTWVYSGLEMVCYVGLLGWYALHLFSRKITNTEIQILGTWGLVMATLPLLLASRSLISYIMFLPVLALAALFQPRSYQPIITEEAGPLD